jgi:hypothetical protein
MSTVVAMRNSSFCCWVCGEENSEDLDADKIKILKLIREIGLKRVGLIHLDQYRTSSMLCEHNNEPSGSKKKGEFGSKF